MPPRDGMNAAELRASVGLAGIFGLRMLGMFVILPVFAIYAEQLHGGDNLTLVGVAMGAYGLTQAILQIPFGWLSDRYGRKPVIYCGLAIFALGSFVAASADSIYGVIFGRIVQGAGAISAAVIAMTADLTREEHRTKAMAMIGSTIGLTFALSLVVSPWLNQVIGVPGIFALTGVLSLLAVVVVYAVIPDVSEDTRIAAPAAPRSAQVLWDPQLARLNFGILALHAVLMALFIVVPLSLRDTGLAVDHHWQVYLPVMLGSFALMLPAILIAERRGHVKTVFVGAIGVLLLGQLSMPWLLDSSAKISAFLLIFFTAFNVLEAMLPSLTSRLAPRGAKGTALGIYSSVQFLGTFIGAASGGFLYQHFGARGVFVFDALLLAAWLLLAFGMRAPGLVLTRVYTIPVLDGEQARALLARLEAQPGVREVRLSAGERTAYLKVDATGFDEQHVLRLIAEEI
jgi:MFS family permease